MKGLINNSLIKEWTKVCIWNILVVIAIILFIEIVIGFFLDHPKQIPLALRYFRSYYMSHDRKIIQYSPEMARYDKNVSYILKPGQYRFKNREFDTDFEVNKAGIRDDEDSLDSPEIIILGDSHAMGWGVKQDQTFAMLIEKSLGIKVLNAAMSSYGTVRELLLLKQLDTSKLRWLLIQYCDNDFYENQTFFLNDNSLPIMSEKEYTDRVNSYLDRSSYFFGKHTIKFVIPKFRQKIKQMMAIKAEEPVGTVRSKEIKEINEVDAFLNTLVYSPTDLTNTNIIIFDINSYGHVNHNFISELKKRKLAKIYPDYIQNMIILDTSHFITPDMFYILDDHMTPLGHRTVAEKILEYIQ